MLGFCSLSAVPMRREARHNSEMVNQLLFGDGVEILEHIEEWCRVRSQYDGYEGWVSDKQLDAVETLPATDCTVTEPFRQLVYMGKRLTVSVGSCCCCEWLAGGAMATAASPVEVALRLLGAPYLWGGRTPMGIDCSGLVQVAFKACGVRLPRDASQQASCGAPVTLGELQAGDLAFFANDEGHIVHVGIAVGDGTIVHASGQVRRDSLTEEGIYNADLHRLTHRLASLRRVMK